MKPKTLLAMAVAGTCAWSTGALAGGAAHTVEVQTPASVSESAPWLTGQSFASSAFDSRGLLRFEDSASIGSSSSMSASGSVGYDSTASASGRLSDVDYWLLGADSHSTSSSDSDSLMSQSESPQDSIGMTSSLGASVSAGFESSLSSEPIENYAITEVYLVPAPLAAFDGDNYWTMEVTPSEDSIDRLASVTDVYVITPIYEEMVDASLIDGTPSDQLSLDMSSDLSQDLAG